MKRFPSPPALAALCAAACGGGGEVTLPDAPSPFCETSAECGRGSWCNPLGKLCEPRGTTYQFEGDIYPMLRDTCATCHVAGVPDTQSPGKNISVFAGGPDVAYASLAEGGTDCQAGLHRLCVNEPKSSLAVVRLRTHVVPPNQTLLLPDDYANPWLQKLLHWTAAGARPSNALADAGMPDAPLVIDAPPGVDASPPDARRFPDAPPPPPDAPGQPVIVSPLAGASTGPNQIPVAWNAAAPNGNAITQYDVAARRVSDGAVTTVTCTAPFTNAPCHINGDQTIGATVNGLQNCVAYDVRVTATNIGGSTASDPVTNVTPRQLPGVPTLPGSPLTRPAAVGELIFNWNASNPNGCGVVSYTVELDPPAGVSCGNGSGAPCLSSTGSTSFDMVTSDGACPYPAINCNTPRVWSFRVRATNAGGTSGFSSQVSGTPRLGYRQDSIWMIWNTVVPPVSNTCMSCHSSFNTLVLSDGGDTTHFPSWNNIRNTPNVAIVGPPPNPDGSLLHLCPTLTTGCNGFFFMTTFPFTGHPGDLRFASGSKEDKLITQWITDGALF